MAFSYSYNPADVPVDFMRFNTGDTDEATHVLEDAEFAYIYATYTASTARLAVAFRQMATRYAHSVTKRSLGPQSEDTTERLRYFTAQAQKYEILASYAGTPSLPEYQDKVFEKDMMGNV